MNFYRNWRQCAAAGAVSLLAAGPAAADAIAVITNSANFSFAAAGLVVLPGTTSPAFFNAAGQRFLVNFTSECAVNAPAGNSSAWSDVDIVVLNAAGAVVSTLAPTVGNQDAFCSANGTAGFDGWESNAISAVGTVAIAGAYRVQVRARHNNGATGAWYGQRTLVVWR